MLIAAFDVPVMGVITFFLHVYSRMSCVSSSFFFHGIRGTFILEGEHVDLYVFSVIPVVFVFYLGL